MKKTLVAVFCFIIVISFVGCGIKSENSDTDLSSSSISEKIKLTEIVDLTILNHLSTDQALEEFYKDKEYTYYFPSIKSQYIECQFSNGDKMPIVEALNSGKVIVSDLDKFAILYWKVDKDGNYTKNIQETTTQEICDGVPLAPEEFMKP